MPTTKSLALFAVGAAAMASGVVVGSAGVSSATTAVCSPPSGYTAVNWTGDAHTSNWTDKDNWSGDALPDPQESGSFSTNYVCIAGGAKVTLDALQAVAGIDLSGGAQVTLTSRAALDVGTAGDSPATSYVRSKSTLLVNGSTFGGNSPVDVGGTLELTGQIIKSKGYPATLVGPGSVTIGSTGALRIDGKSWGQTELQAKEPIDNSGTLTFANDGFLEMDNGAVLTDESSSTLALDGNGGIYRTTPTTASGGPTVTQKGTITETGSGSSVVGVGTHLSGAKVTVHKGTVALNASSLPTATMAPDTSYGIGTCDILENQICHIVEADKLVPESALVTTSTEAPKTQSIRLKLNGTNPSKVGGKALIGKEVSVTAPEPKTTHSTHLTLTFDVTVKGVKKGLKPNVYRNGHKITYCSAHGLTAINTSCVSTAKTLTAPSPAKGDLQLFIITIQPKATWAVTTA